MRSSTTLFSIAPLPTAHSLAPVGELRMLERGGARSTPTLNHSCPPPGSALAAAHAKTLSLTVWSPWLCSGIREALSLAISRSWRLPAVSREQSLNFAVTVRSYATHS